MNLPKISLGLLHAQPSFAHWLHHVVQQREKVVDLTVQSLNQIKEDVTNNAQFANLFSDRDEQILDHKCWHGWHRVHEGLKEYELNIKEFDLRLEQSNIVSEWKPFGRVSDATLSQVLRWYYPRSFLEYYSLIRQVMSHLHPLLERHVRAIRRIISRKMPTEEEFDDLKEYQSIIDMCQKTQEGLQRLAAAIAPSPPETRVKLDVSNDGKTTHTTPAPLKIEAVVQGPSSDVRIRLRNKQDQNEVHTYDIYENKITIQPLAFKRIKYVWFTEAVYSQDGHEYVIPLGIWHMDLSTITDATGVIVEEDWLTVQGIDASQATQLVQEPGTLAWTVNNSPCVGHVTGAHEVSSETMAVEEGAQTITVLWEWRESWPYEITVRVANATHSLSQTVLGQQLNDHSLFSLNLKSLRQQLGLQGSAQVTVSFDIQVERTTTTQKTVEIPYPLIIPSGLPRWPSLHCEEDLPKTVQVDYLVHGPLQINGQTYKDLVVTNGFNINSDGRGQLLERIKLGPVAGGEEHVGWFFHDNRHFAYHVYDSQGYSREWSQEIYDVLVVAATFSENAVINALTFEPMVRNFRSTLWNGSNDGNDTLMRLSAEEKEELTEDLERGSVEFIDLEPTVVQFPTVKRLKQEIDTGIEQIRSLFGTPDNLALVYHDLLTVGKSHRLSQDTVLGPQGIACLMLPLPLGFVDAMNITPHVSKGYAQQGEDDPWTVRSNGNTPIEAIDQINPQATLMAQALWENKPEILTQESDSQAPPEAQEDEPPAKPAITVDHDMEIRVAHSGQTIDQDAPLQLIAGQEEDVEVTVRCANPLNSLTVTIFSEQDQFHRLTPSQDGWVVPTSQIAKDVKPGQYNAKFIAWLNEDEEGGERVGETPIAVTIVEPPSDTHTVDVGGASVEVPAAHANKFTFDPAELDLDVNGDGSVEQTDGTDQPTHSEPSTVQIRSDWPGLQTGEPLPSNITVDYLTWGKVHGASTDYRLIARSGEWAWFDSVRSEILRSSFMGRPPANDSLSWIFVQRRLAVHHFPSRSSDASGRGHGGNVDSIFLDCSQISNPCLASLLFLSLAEQTRNPVSLQDQVTLLSQRPEEFVQVNPLTLSVTDEIIQGLIAQGVESIHGCFGDMNRLAQLYNELLSQKHAFCLPQENKLSGVGMACLLLPLSVEQGEKITMGNSLWERPDPRVLQLTIRPQISSVSFSDPEPSSEVSDEALRLATAVWNNDPSLLSSSAGSSVSETAGEPAAQPLLTDDLAIDATLTESPTVVEGVDGEPPSEEPRDMDASAEPVEVGSAGEGTLREKRQIDELAVGSAGADDLRSMIEEMMKRKKT